MLRVPVWAAYRREFRQDGDCTPRRQYAAYDKQRDGPPAAFPVAARGEVFVDGLSERNRLVADWRGQTCRFTVNLEKEGPVQPRIGPITCSGVEK